MKDEELKDGQVYRLTRDVQNPKVDRRGKNLRRYGSEPADHEWVEKMETWPKGMRFRFTARPNPDSEKGTIAYQIENFDGRYHHGIGPKEWAPDFELVEAFEPEPESFDTVMARISDDSDAGYVRAWDMLRVLFESRIITRIQLAKAYEKAHRE